MKYLIAGLGNIGPEYANTRHNLGFMALDKFAEMAGFTFESKRYAWNAEFRYKGRTFILIKPTTFMNLSGKAIIYWLKKENIPDENLLVIADDIALPLGTLRLRKKGGAGGHNGLTNVIEHLGTDNFSRLRIGAGGDYPRLPDGAVDEQKYQRDPEPGDDFALNFCADGELGFLGFLLFAFLRLHVPPLRAFLFAACRRRYRACRFPVCHFRCLRALRVAQDRWDSSRYSRKCRRCRRRP